MRVRFQKNAIARSLRVRFGNGRSDRASASTPWGSALVIIRNVEVKEVE
jgi:hypothetical protein